MCTRLKINITKLDRNSSDSILDIVKVHNTYERSLPISYSYYTSGKCGVFIQIWTYIVMEEMFYQSGTYLQCEYCTYNVSIVLTM